jgi:hypothetical protein
VKKVKNKQMMIMMDMTVMRREKRRRDKIKRTSWKMEEMPERKLGYCRIPTFLTTIFVFLQDKHIYPKEKRIFLHEQLILHCKLSLSLTECTT